MGLFIYFFDHALSVVGLSVGLYVGFHVGLFVGLCMGLLSVGATVVVSGHIWHIQNPNHHVKASQISPECLCLWLVQIFLFEL
jgi:hypothetical protein